MAQGELARNLIEGRGFVVNTAFADSVGALQQREQRLVDITEGLVRYHPGDRPNDFRPFIAYMMPGQGILLAATYGVFGQYRYIYLQTIQAVLDSLGAFLIFSIASVVTSRRGALLASLLFAVYIPEARLAISATRDAWMPLIYLSFTFCFIHAWRTRQLKWFLGGGIVLAFGTYFRSEILLLPLFLSAVLLVFRFPRRVIGTAILAMIVPALFFLLPWTIRNYRVFHRFIPTNSGLWVAMWQSFGEYENSFGAVNNDVVTLRQMRALGHTEEFDSPEYDDLFRERVLNVVTEHPLWVGWTVVRRLARIPFQKQSWGIALIDAPPPRRGPYHAGSADLVQYWRYISEIPERLLAHGFARGVSLVLYGSAVWWLIRRRSDWRAALALLSVPVYNILIHVLIGVQARYILPTNALLLIPTAVLFLRVLHTKGESDAPSPS